MEEVEVDKVEDEEEEEEEEEEERAEEEEERAEKVEDGTSRLLSLRGVAEGGGSFSVSKSFMTCTTGDS